MITHLLEKGKHPMRSLSDILANIPLSLLLHIGRYCELRYQTNIRKPALISRLIPVLRNTERIIQRSKKVPPVSLQALQVLVSTTRPLPLRHLQQEYGVVRQAVDLARAISQARRAALPISEVASPLEALWLFGLAFVDQKSETIVVPDVIRTALDQTETSTPSKALCDSVSLTTPPSNTPQATAIFRHDLTVLLGLCQREPIKTLHNRWLTPRKLTQWAHLSHNPPQNESAKSELQTDRRRFLHYCAITAHLLAVQDGVLILSPVAWEWLRQPTESQLNHIWQAWCQPKAELWAQFQQPGHVWLTHPTRFLHILLTALPTYLSSTPTLIVADFAAWLRLQHPLLHDFVPPNFENPVETLTQTITDILTGPLTWLGLLQSQKEALVLTPWGAHLLLQTEAPPEPPLAHYQRAFTFQADPLLSTFTLQQPSQSLPIPYHQLGAMLLHDTAQKSPNTLTATRFAQLLQAGWSPEALLDLIQTITQHPLSASEANVLQTWTEAAQKVSITTVPLLETTDPAILTRLSQNRRGRTQVVRTLSPRAAVVDGFTLPQLVKRLTAQEGISPQVNRHQQAGHVNQAGLTLDRNTHAVLALQVYQALGKYIALPSQLPPNLLDDLNTSLTDFELATAEAGTQQIIAALEDALMGRTVFPPWPESGLPIEETIPIIEAALAEGTTVSLDYYALSTDTVTHRLVEPYRLEWHGDPPQGTPYLIGFCHRAQAERTFRLDRIREIGSRE